MVSRVGIEPTSHAPKARILPLNYPEILPKQKNPLILVRVTGFGGIRNEFTQTSGRLSALNVYAGRANATGLTALCDELIILSMDWRLEVFIYIYYNTLFLKECNYFQIIFSKILQWQCSQGNHLQNNTHDYLES